MSERGKELFNRLKRVKAILALIGESEDSHLDCKEWPSDEKSAQSLLAKAACGFANAEGGVILVGMKARPNSKGEPDLIQSAAPVTDASAVKSRILDLLGQIVEPGIEGIHVAKVNEKAGSKSGFVVVYIPAADGPPRRSKKDWKFYVRIASGTLPMEYFQIEERFGKRPPPRLELHLKQEGITAALHLSPHAPVRWLALSLQNLGAGIAKFPSIRYKRAAAVIVDPQSPIGLSRRATDNEWDAFRGGVDDVIYPGETRKIARLAQQSRNTGIDPDPRPALGHLGASGQTIRAFDAINFQCEISCEGAATKTVEKAIPEESVAWR
jgi:hypothetical protein